MPPSTAVKWNAQSYEDWDTPGNWIPNYFTPDYGHALFGAVQGGALGPEITVTTSKDRQLQSLWFDASAGIWYTIAGTGTLKLGTGLEGGNIITVISDLTQVSEANIENAISFDKIMPTRDLWIRNDSLGGLRIGGTFDIGSHRLKISNTGKPLARSAVHLNGAITGWGSISTVNGATQHLVLQADNSAWNGTLHVGSNTLVFVKSNRALGTGNSYVNNSGTLGFRSHVGSTLNYTAPAQTSYVGGEGAVRTWGQSGVGAIYHDGGLNSFSGNIEMWGHTSFGARGDSGGLTLSGKISGGNIQFTKVGHGLITLTNPTNDWSGPTYIMEGVLRITTRNALPLNAPLWFGYQGVLELGGNVNNVNFDIGPQLLAYGTLGFSAHGGDKTVSANGAGYVFQESDTYRFNLSSRYADSKITLNNGFPTQVKEYYLSSGTIVWEGHSTIIDVPRGVSIHASAEISGPPPLLYKTGRGLLEAYGTPQVPIKTIHSIMDGALILGDLNIGVNGIWKHGIMLAGGVLGLISDLLRPASLFQWAINGGFAAYGAADRVVRLDNSTHTIDWRIDSFETNDHMNFVQEGKMLMFGHYTSDGTILWDKQLGLGTNQNRVINVERGIPAAAAGRADVSFTQAISGTGGSLTIQGDGRMDIAVDNPNLQVTTININGTELRLQQAGRIATQATNFVLKNGGTLTLDNTGTHKATAGGSHQANRIHDSSPIYLDAATVRYWGSNTSSEEKVGTITLQDGANTIDVRNSGGFSAKLKSLALSRASSSPATANLSLSSTLAEFILDTWTVGHAINDVVGGTRVSPWATVNGTDWATPVTVGGLTTLSALSSYHSNLFSAGSSHNVHLAAGVMPFNQAAVINSFKMSDGAALNLGAYSFVIRSGGLLVVGASSSSIFGSGSITTVSTRPLYTHVYASYGFSLSGQTKFNVPSLVKTGPSTLWLNSDTTHNLGSGLHIHQGVVDLQQGSINVGKIVIGDGAGKDIFKLPANRWNPLTGKPDITLRGTPYGPGAEYASYNPDEAILQLGGNTKQTIGTLRIEDRGTIDWVGGEVGKANMLFVDKLEFNNADARLFMRNWYEFEDYLLLKKTGLGDGSILKQIIFDGYWDLPALAVNYDANSDYFIITPFNAPEPSTYGAILGTVGLGLAAWRKKRRTVKSK